MKNQKKFDKLMHDVTQGKLNDKSDELISRMEEVLVEEKLGTLDDMMNDIRDYLDSKNKLKDYLNENGVMKLPLEIVFSWFSNSIYKLKLEDEKQS